MLVVRERRAFAGGAHGADAARAGVDLKIDLGLQRPVIDLAIAKGRGDGDREPGKRFAFGGHD